MNKITLTAGKATLYKLITAIEADSLTTYCKQEIGFAALFTCSKSDFIHHTYMYIHFTLADVNHLTNAF